MNSLLKVFIYYNIQALSFSVSCIRSLREVSVQYRKSYICPLLFWIHFRSDILFGIILPASNLKRKITLQNYHKEHVPLNMISSLYFWFIISIKSFASFSLPLYKIIYRKRLIACSRLLLLFYGKIINKVLIYITRGLVNEILQNNYW